MENRPQGREKRVTGPGKSLGRRGSGLGTGPVGNAGGYTGRKEGSAGRPGSSGSTRAGGSGGGLLKLILLVIVLLGGGSGAFSLLGGETMDQIPVNTQPSYSQTTPTAPQSSQTNPFEALFGGSGSFTSSTGTSSGGWLEGSNTGKLNTSVDPSAREKRTDILGGGKDTVTIMVYMCGTDLESRSGMATKDLQEMLNATLSDRVNLLVYTGGCTRWQNNVISSNVNQIYKVENEGLQCLEKDAGTGAMTSPKTLTSFIRYCSKNYPANRNFLILWDHGGGSISGYGYDEKNKSAGSMNLKGLSEALSNAGTEFDMIGFDACLMATLETGLTMANYGDYLVASEETEPGLGWYYTDWLTALSKNTSMSTLEVGKKIADDFVSACARSCPGQKTTLSVVDLAELEATVPGEFKAFSASTLELLKNDGYEKVSNARSTVREFAVSNKIDQIDLVHLAAKLDTAESRALAQTILYAVKYNKTSSDMTNAYGVSLYFPYQKTSNVNNAVATYNAIGLDSTYTDCIRTFASLEVSGQTAAGGATSPWTSLSGQSYGGSAVGSDLLGQMLGQLLSGGATSSFFDRSLDLDNTAAYLAANRFDPDALLWSSNGNGYVLHMSEKQWSLVQDLELNVFADDGEGYIDLGLDNTFDFTDDGELIGAYDGTWLAIDGQPVAYYHMDTTQDDSGYSIMGRVPVLLNGERAELILVFTTENPYGSIVGARTVYHDGETETVAKSMTQLEVGDVIDYICDYYTYSGEYQDSYLIGEPHVYTGTEEISNVYLDVPCSATYRVTDIYNNAFWTPEIP